MKHTIFTGLLFSISLFGQGTPNCSQSLSFTSATPGAAINTISGAAAGCAGWRLTWSVTGFTAATVQLEGSQDNSSWGAFGSALVQEGTNPTSWTSATTSNTIVVRASLPYVRVNITAVTGSGTIKTTILGYSGTSAQLDTGSGGGAPTGPAGGDLSGTYPNPVVNQARSGQVTFDTSGNVVAKGSYTSGSGSGLTGALDLTGATSGSTVTVTVGTSTGTGTITMPGATGTAAYSASAGTSGHCIQYASDGIGLVDAGAACGSGTGGSTGYSASNAVSAGTTYYLAPVGGAPASTTEANVQGRANVASAITNLYVQLSAAPGTGNSIAVTLRDGGSSEALTCTVSGAATTCNDTTHSFTPAANDLIDFQVVDTGVTATDDFVITYSYGSGGSGALVQLAQIVLASSQATVTFSSISSAYTSLRLISVVRCDEAATSDGAYIQFNGDTGNNYSRNFFNATNTTFSGGQNLSGATSNAVIVATCATALANAAAVNETLIPSYAGTTFAKQAQTTTSLVNGGSISGLQNFSLAGYWTGTAAISSMKIALLGGGNFVAGSTFTLYGVR